MYEGAVFLATASIGTHVSQEKSLVPPANLKNIIIQARWGPARQCHPLALQYEIPRAAVQPYNTKKQTEICSPMPFLGTALQFPSLLGSSISLLG